MGLIKGWSPSKAIFSSHDSLYTCLDDIFESVMYESYGGIVGILSDFDQEKPWDIIKDSMIRT